MPISLPKTDSDFEAINAQFANLSLEDRLSNIVDMMNGRIVFTTSFGAEDQAITHAIFDNALPIKIVTLDTGRMFEETYSLWSDTESRYGKTIKAYYPDRESVENLVTENGINGFYSSLAKRKACCFVRKVEPLNRALEGASLWVTGIRSEQNASRQTMSFFEHDTDRDLYKFNPILDWSQDTLDTYIKEREVSVNELHGRGYPSIGCQPCTRAIEPGEDARAGRWWWENDDGAAGGECGLHMNADGQLVRAKTTPSGLLVD